MSLPTASASLQEHSDHAPRPPAASSHNCRRPPPLRLLATDRLFACAHLCFCRRCALQTLKIIRYTTRLLLATSFAGSQTDLAQRLKRFESSIGTSRCAAGRGALGAGGGGCNRASVRVQSIFGQGRIRSATSTQAVHPP